jgi:hypothetical protein
MKQSLLEELVYSAGAAVFLLTELYNNGKISCETFYEHTRVKVHFLYSNIEYIQTLSENAFILKLLENFNSTVFQAERA